MGKSQKPKLERAMELLDQQIPYREIQEILKNEFGSGLSNTSLRNIQKEQDTLEQLTDENQRLKEELAIFKKLYFELVEATKLMFNKDEEK